MQTVKSTINLPQVTMDQVKELVASKEFSSVTEVIKTGIELVLREKRKEWYESEMQNAWSDDNFKERTLSCQKDLDSIDEGVAELW